MNHAIFDSNILIDYLSGNLDALSAIDACDHPAISKIVYMEGWSGASMPQWYTWQRLRITMMPCRL